MTTAEEKLAAMGPLELTPLAYAWLEQRAGVRLSRVQARADLYAVFTGKSGA